MSAADSTPSNAGSPQHVLVVDDLAASRAWMLRALGLAFPQAQVRQADCLAAGLLMLEPTPDIAVIDLGLPDGSGIELIEVLRRAERPPLCIVATVFDDDGHLFPALRAGAEGYLLKDQPAEAVAQALTGIAEGRPPLSPSIARRLLSHFRPTPAPQNEAVALTARETEVLQAIAKGYTVQQVAGLLSLSPHTVAGYLKEVYRKLAVSSRAEATLEAARRGLIASA
jgi:DNA-binding NarL/FixJ family response regulator